MVQLSAPVLSLAQEEMQFLSNIMVVIFGLLWKACDLHYKCIVGVLWLCGGLLGCTTDFILLWFCLTDLLVELRATLLTQDGGH